MQTQDEIMAMADEHTLLTNSLEAAERAGREEGIAIGESRGVAKALVEMLDPLIGDKLFARNLVEQLSDLRLEPLMKMVRAARSATTVEEVVGTHMPRELRFAGLIDVEEEESDHPYLLITDEDGVSRWDWDPNWRPRQ